MRMEIFRKISLLALLFSSPGFAQELTTYLPEWSGYASGQYVPYAFDGSYTNSWHSNTKVSNADMVMKAQLSDVLVYSFLQVWNHNSTKSQQFTVPANWDGHLHFDDVWGNLPNQTATEYPTWKDFCTAAPAGTCSAIQQDCSSGSCHLNLLDFNNLDIGQLNNFGAFLNLPTSARKIIAIGGANTPDNQSVGYDTFQAIFANETEFLNSLFYFKLHAVGLNGIDYDFEPPINADGSQKNPDNTTLQDYANLFKLVKDTRDKLGPNTYISVTITTNEDYLESINHSIPDGWFAQIAQYVNAINIMTYDMHGPWSSTEDPGAISHAMLQNLSLIDFSKYAIKYSIADVVTKVIGYGLPANKLQIGIAAYGRGFAGVEAGATSYPGFAQPWTSASKFPEQFSQQAGLLPYKFVQAVLAGQAGGNYQTYDINEQNHVIASYLYSTDTKQLVGYMSPGLVKSLCQYAKDSQLQGAILWSMDMDANDLDQGISLIKTYSDACRVLSN
jgi:chitinase